MDTGKGCFEMLSDEQFHDIMEKPVKRGLLFSVGEEVTIKQSRFRIVKITPKKLTLRILPKIG